jgi:hypothetical protein
MPEASCTPPTAAGGLQIAADQREKAVNVAAVDGKPPIHVTLSHIHAGIKEQLPVQAAIMQADGNGGFGVIAERVPLVMGVDDNKGPLTHKAVKQTRK